MGLSPKTVTRLSFTRGRRQKAQDSPMSNPRHDTSVLRKQCILYVIIIIIIDIIYNIFITINMAKFTIEALYY